jgi:hypothetical protein
VLKISTADLIGPSSLYTIEGDHNMEKLALGYYTKKVINVHLLLIYTRPQHFIHFKTFYHDLVY